MQLWCQVDCQWKHFVCSYKRRKYWEVKPAPYTPTAKKMLPRNCMKGILISVYQLVVPKQKEVRTRITEHKPRKDTEEDIWRSINRLKVNW